jgi:DNA-binding CsgD family transcriptional regulator
VDGLGLTAREPPAPDARPGGRTVRVVPGAPLLTAGIVAGLRTQGWEVEASSPTPPPKRPRDTWGSSLVLVPDDEGRLPDSRGLRDAHRVVVAVAPRTGTAGLVTACARGVVVVSAELPYARLVHALDVALATPRGRQRPDGQAERLRRRLSEAERFSRLTLREQDVLGALVLGRSAAEIACERCVSITTVRSHIRSILSTLGVSSQLAAVAMTHRSCHEPRVLAHLDRLHQF